MHEQVGGYFEGEFVREMLTRVGKPVDQMMFSLDNPTIQRKVARMSIMRALRMYDKLGGRVIVFRRNLPNPDTGEIEVKSYVVDMGKPDEYEGLKKLYNDLVDMEKKPDTPEVVTYLDDFMRNI